MVLDKIKNNIAEFFYRCGYRRASAAFEKAIPRRYFLPDSDFKHFVEKYGAMEAKPFQDYSPGGLEKFAVEKSELLSSQADVKGKKILEIGSATGKILKKLIEKGAQEVTGVDIEDKRLDEVKSSGVKMMVQGAEDLHQVPDHYYDLIYSFSAFEHIADVSGAFRESFRVLKPGGTIYFQIGCLYYSPWGYHYYSYLKIPYIHILFNEKILRDYLISIGKEPFIPWTNRLCFEHYFEAVKNRPADVIVAEFSYGYDWYHANLIREYPEVFKSKNVNFHNFFIDTVTVKLVKID